MSTDMDIVDKLLLVHDLLEDATELWLHDARIGHAHLVREGAQWYFDSEATPAERRTYYPTLYHALQVYRETKNTVRAEAAQNRKRQQPNWR